MASFEIALEPMLKTEGGYANHKNDKGGETYKGISRKHWPKWNGWVIVDQVKLVAKTIQEINRMLESNYRIQNMVKDFYKMNFWSPYMQELSQDLANWVFDKSVHMGQSQAAKLLQRAVGASPDGKVGPLTKQAINKYINSGKDILEACREQAREFYKQIVVRDPSQMVFLNGWLARA